MIRVAGAPISWGVCEVPGWGHCMPADRVLREMSALGLTATELGPDGYLPADPAERAELLGRHHLEVAGGFVPVVLHDPGHDPVPGVVRALTAWSGVLVLAAATGTDGYDTRPDLDALGWQTLLGNLDQINTAAAERGVTATLHPHIGTMVEGPDEVRRVLDGSAIPLCLDTGHLLAGGTDPAALAREVPGRIAHVHLKDVDAASAARVRAGEVSYTDAVRAGLYRPLGDGDVDIAAIVGALTAAGYAGWYVLEQDTMLDAEPAAGEGPVADVRRSLEHLRKVAA
ncbi:inosose dehydratase [Asanoa ferruginea]|uniref:Inosose dehydratase n=1 Tax=Asanoa ferruginea TaxID=53367 RepID=A0A3D9ZV88_9ACTN|nr:TIM barrel protein [Asanoa ferruginea]REF99923.1 inosose dehydratase [Asanoa ferruginea]GIF51614.1 inosose dehydratase [Asanoa ferruginea]